MTRPGTVRRGVAGHGRARHGTAGEDGAAQIDRRLSPSDLPQYLTVQEIMAYLQIGRSAAYLFARQHGVKIGRLLRVPREALTAKALSRNS